MHVMRILAMALCLSVGCAAFAETENDIRCWTTNEDAYYHMDQDCGEWEMYPISESAALAFGKTACQSCVIANTPEVFHEDSDIWLAVRSGTYVLCIPGASMDRIYELPAVEAPETEMLTGEAAKSRVEALLSEDGYADMLKRLQADGWAQDSYRIPELLTDEDVLPMSARQIDGDWYFVIRPEKNFGTEAELRWRISEWEIRMEGADSVTLTRSHAGEYSSRLAVENHADTGTIYEKDYGDLEITVYRRQGMNTAVIRDSGKTKAKLSKTFILNDEAVADVKGYINNRKQATYCCIISDAELGGLVAGWLPVIRYE